MPTKDEINGAFVIKPPIWWGSRIRNERSLNERVAFIGGSQTANGGYVKAFENHIKEVMSSLKVTVSLLCIMRAFQVELPSDGLDHSSLNLRKNGQMLYL